MTDSEFIQQSDNPNQESLMPQVVDTQPTKILPDKVLNPSATLFSAVLHA